MDTSYVTIAENVREALTAGQPVVALESTIISHGMPYPQNVETARLVEATVRENGAVPATIGIIEGRCIVGLSTPEIETLGVSGEETVKVSRRDLPIVAARKLNGATTVAATMIIAEMAGIPVFATGGIGGVHRGASLSFVIYAPLQEQAPTNVNVVSAGAKAILDIALTLEYLETHGVPVIGYQTDEMPAFYSRSSGCDLSCRADSPKEIAEILAAKQLLDLPGGTVIANPIPEEYQMPADLINTAISTALSEMDSLGISGKDATPFLLAKIVELTRGSSLEANIHLVHNNAALAAQIAKELCEL
jgi:pseudouridine-5'-phosphate glycosidase